LRELLALIPPDVVIGLEIPMLSRAEAGETTTSIVEHGVSAARALLTTVME
jgi:hypothetical protein